MPGWFISDFQNYLKKLKIDIGVIHSNKNLLIFIPQTN
jgi:hypothetical protein